MNQFTNYVELQAEKAENLSFCRGIKLLHIRDKVETMLGFIGKGGIFEEYTVHSIEHIDEMLKIVEWLIPDITKEKMTYAEWLMLTLAIYFHDLGMVVTKDEFEHRDETGFKEYKEKVLENTEEFEYEECAKERGDSFLYQEFVRENHAARIRQWIEGKNARNLGEAEAVCQEIEDILKNLDKMFKADLAMICESHHKDDIEDFSKYKVKKMYGNTENEKVNLNYIAIILRTADLLHITRDRTPSVARRLINVSNPVSVLEWEKQMAVRAVRPKDQRNEEGVVDNSKQKDTIEITAYFDGAETAEAYFGLSSYLQYTRKELAKCCEIVEKAQKREGAVGYEFPWREVDESQIKYLNETGHDVDGEKYDVYEKKHGNVTVAYAVRHLKYMSDWCLMSADNRRVQRKAILPIGTCVEGIRVEFSTPGYKNTSILAIANIKNSKYQTNVARSAIELDANNEILSDIYDVYKDYVQEQMDRLEDQDYAQSWAVSEGRYLMRPLIYDDYSNSRIEPIDEDVLIHRLAHLKCLALENEGVRQIVSAEDVAELEEINIFECEMTRAGEYLLKEVRSSATLSSLIGVVCKDNFLAGVKNVICNIDMGNLLHQYALKNKEVSKIEVAHKERRIHVTYSCKNDLWYEFDLRNRGLAARSLYIPKKNMVISGLKEEIGVKNFGGIYIQSNTELCEYLIKVIGAFQSEDTEENKILLKVFLSYVFDNKVLEVAYKQDVNTSNMFKQLLEERFVRVSNELIEKMWAKIDTQEFVNKILTKNYTLYSIDNWSRKNDSI